MRNLYFIRYKCTYFISRHSPPQRQLGLIDVTAAKIRVRNRNRPNTNLPFVRGAKFSPDDFVTEGKRSFQRPADDAFVDRQRLARVSTGIKLEGERTMTTSSR